MTFRTEKNTSTGRSISEITPSATRSASENALQYARDAEYHSDDARYHKAYRKAEIDCLFAHNIPSLNHLVS